MISFNGTSTKTRIETAILKARYFASLKGFNGTSTKTRIETLDCDNISSRKGLVLMEHPPKQGLKHTTNAVEVFERLCFNGTSTKTRIETQQTKSCTVSECFGFNGTSTKTRIETFYHLHLFPQALWF